MSLTLGLTAAVSGLQTAQKGLDLVSHNIANVNTEGFTRKIFNAESVVLAGRGAGVQTGAITRQVDQNLLKDLQKETGINARLLTLDDYYSRMQDMWGEPGSNNSISHIVASLGAEFESLAVSPNASTEQATVVDSAVRMLDKLNLMTDEIQSLRLQADKELEAYATQINTRLTNISNLNDKIVYSMATAQTGTTDLQDKRDLELLKLSELMDVQAFERDNGSIVVFSNGGSTLVDSTANTVSHTSLTLVNPWLSHAGGDFGDISVANLDVTNDFGRGRARGLVELRDSILPDLQAEIDQLTTTM
ncbi:MAG: flagellar hook-associated protein FlgK, partial [Alphaproteobacteria bacterium RIFOXYD12_FULL_60_8]